MRQAPRTLDDESGGVGDRSSSRSPDLDLGLALLHLLTQQTPSPERGADRLTRFSLDESFTLTPQARSALGKVSDQPSCVQFRNMEPVGAKHPAGEHWGPGTDGLGSRTLSHTLGAACHFPVARSSSLPLNHTVSSQLAQPIPEEYVNGQ